MKLIRNSWSSSLNALRRKIHSLELKQWQFQFQLKNRLPSLWQQNPCNQHAPKARRSMSTTSKRTWTLSTRNQLQTFIFPHSNVTINYILTIFGSETVNGNQVENQLWTRVTNEGYSSHKMDFFDKQFCDFCGQKWTYFLRKCDSLALWYSVENGCIFWKSQNGFLLFRNSKRYCG